MNLKHLVAALALVAAGSANAAIDNAASGNGELFLVVNDDTAGFSFVADLGIKMNDFNPVSMPQPFNLNSFSQWAPFYAAIGGSLSNSIFTVLAMDSLGTKAGDDRMWVSTSSAVLIDDIKATQSKMLGGATPTADVLLGKLNINEDVAAGDMQQMANGSAYSAKGTTTYWMDNMGIALQAKLPFSVMTAANESANFGFMVTTGTQTSLTPIGDNYVQAAGQWTIENNNLIYTVPVPEAETYAMLLAGLGLVGFAARRRKAA